MKSISIIEAQNSLVSFNTNIYYLVRENKEKTSKKA